MEEKNRKTWKERIKIIKRKILVYRKTILYYSKILIIVFIEITTILIIYLSNKLQINKEMLYWFFSTTAQSMAALFAIIGVFAVFRYQLQENKLRNLYDSLKKRFLLPSWIYHFGVTGAESWKDSVIADRAEELLEMKESRLPHNIKFNIKMDVLYIRHHEKARHSVLTKAKIPLVAVLITFVLSIIFISFIESILKNVIALIILMFMMALITFSMIDLFYYIIYSISPNKEK